MDTQADMNTRVNQESCIAPKGQYRLIEKKVEINYEKEYVHVKATSPYLFEIRAEKRHNLEADLKWKRTNSKYFIFDDQGKEVIKDEEKKYVIKKDSSLFKFRKKYLPKMKLPANRCAFFEQIMMAFLVMCLKPFYKTGWRCLDCLIRGIAYFLGKRIDEYESSGYVWLHSYKWNPKKNDYDRYAPWEIAAMTVVPVSLVISVIYHFWLLKWYAVALAAISIAFFVVAGIIKIWPFIKLAYLYFKDKKNGFCLLVEYKD